MSIINIVLVSLLAYVGSIIVALAFYAIAIRPYWKMSDDIEFFVNNADTMIMRVQQIGLMAKNIQVVLQILFTCVAFWIAFN